MFVVGLLVGGFIGGLFVRFVYDRLRIGTLQVDRSDPSEPPMLLLLLSKKDAYKVETKKYVLLKVKHEDLISQK